MELCWKVITTMVQGIHLSCTHLLLSDLLLEVLHACVILSPFALLAHVFQFLVGVVLLLGRAREWLTALPRVI